MGETTAKYLAEHFRSLDAVMRATREELVEADEVGGRIADAIIEYFAEEDNLRIIRRLRAAGCNSKPRRAAWRRRRWRAGVSWSRASSRGAATK